MQSRAWIVIGALCAGAGVTLGAFGAHALKDVLEEAGQLENWRTAVRYQMWHALALVAYGLHRRGATGGKAAAGWCFTVGSTFFSGSIYCLCFGILKPVMGPVTPLGGLLLIVGWVLFAVEAARTP